MIICIIVKAILIAVLFTANVWASRPWHTAGMCSMIAVGAIGFLVNPAAMLWAGYAAGRRAQWIYAVIIVLASAVTLHWAPLIWASVYAMPARNRILSEALSGKATLAYMGVLYLLFVSGFVIGKRQRKRAKGVVQTL